MESKSSSVQRPLGQTTDQPGSASHPRPQSGRTTAARRLTSDEVFAGAVEVLIRHGEVDYRLRRTGLGKLILTK